MISIFDATYAFYGLYSAEFHVSLFIYDGDYGDGYVDSHGVRYQHPHTQQQVYEVTPGHVRTITRARHDATVNGLQTRRRWKGL